MRDPSRRTPAGEPLFVGFAGTEGRSSGNEGDLDGRDGDGGEGVLLESPLVQRVPSVSRRPCGRTHAKLTELLVADFRELGPVQAELTGYDAGFYCAGISSLGMKEADYTAVTYDTPLAFADAGAAEPDDDVRPRLRCEPGRNREQGRQ